MEIIGTIFLTSLFLLLIWKVFQFGVFYGEEKTLNEIYGGRNEEELRKIV